MTKSLVIDPFSGVSGDMFIASLADLGVPFDEVSGPILAMPVFKGVRAELTRVTRGVFGAARVTVECPRVHEHRSLSDVRKIVEGTKLGERVQTGIMKTFDALAAAESKVHGCGKDEVHFHEVGALDAMFDIFAAHLALEHLGNPECYTRPIALGAGKTVCAHGEIPLPAPAALELLGGFDVKFTDRDEELVTPTGAAIVASLFKPLGPDALVVPSRVGYGAGSREGKGLPNVLRAILCEIEERPARVAILTSTIDDMNPEVYGYLMEQLLGRGALDVYYNAVMMKKNRPGVEVTVIAEEKDAAGVADYLMTETTTLGVRVHSEERVELARRRETLPTRYGEVAVKVARRPGGAETMSPEYESCRAIAAKSGVPLVEVYEAARKAWTEKEGRG
jgi:uncharacterized protein (TIGR00299 family) protein